MDLEQWQNHLQQGQLQVQNRALHLATVLYENLIDKAENDELTVNQTLHALSIVTAKIQPELHSFEINANQRLDIISSELGSSSDEVQHFISQYTNEKINPNLN